jgi:hypothetical protein
MRLLLCDALAHAAELAEGAINLLPHRLTRAGFHLGYGRMEAPAGPVQDGRHHLQIAQQFSIWRGALWARWGRGRDLLVRFQKQFGLSQNPFPEAG